VAQTLPVVKKGSAMPETFTATVENLEGVAEWARQNVSPADQSRINAIIEAHGKDQERRYADQSTLWEIDWFYRGGVKEFYRMALVNSGTLRELWGYS
jgi:hypothetical protein